MTECDGDCLVGVLSVQYEGDAPIYKSELYQGYQDSKDFTWYNYCPFCGKEVEHGKEVDGQTSVGSNPTLTSI